MMKLPSDSHQNPLFQQKILQGRLLSLTSTLSKLLGSVLEYYLILREILTTTNRQLTLHEFALYKAIKPKELMNQAWSKKKNEINSPNVLRFISSVNKVSHSRSVCVSVAHTNNPSYSQRLQNGWDKRSSARRTSNLA